MSIYWSDIVKKIEPYVPGEQPKDRRYIKLNTNENPYPPSPRVLEAIRKAAGESLKLYPDPNCDELRETIAGYYKLEKEQVFVGNGSDEVLAFAFMSFFNPWKTILFPDITYSFYPVYADLFNIDYKTVPLDGDFGVDVAGFKRDNGGVVIANPNAPTGKCLGLESIEEILEANIDSVVLVDEAYIYFGGESSVKLIDKYPNLLVVNTMSKSHSLAGLRVGYALGRRDLIQAMDRIKNSFNSYTLDRLAIAGAIEAFKDEEYYRVLRTKIISTRERVSKGLREMGFKLTDSKANFIFISHPEFQAGDLFVRLKENGILVRHFNKPRIDNYLRVSIGSDEEMDAFLDVVRRLVKA